MMDGIDGLSSMVFIVAGTAMAWLALRSGLVFSAAMIMIVVAAVLGFFLLNARLPGRERAKVFLGDSGSLFLGMFLAWQFIDLGSGDDRVGVIYRRHRHSRPNARMARIPDVLRLHSLLPGLPVHHASLLETRPFFRPGSGHSGSLT